LHITKNKEALKASRKRTKLKKNYGLFEEEVKAQLEYQNYQCAICGTEVSYDGIHSHIDHDHLTKKLRGILCSNCNHGLGMFNDRITTLTKAIDYLQAQGCWKGRDE
jgi:DNA-directed RNA polymerase subunit RPC12/RpoP